MSHGIVHLKPATRTHPQLGTVVSGSAVSLREAALRRAQDMGYEVRDIPGDGRYHPLWPGQGPGGSNPCPSCTAWAVYEDAYQAQIEWYFGRPDVPTGRKIWRWLTRWWR